jgi:hypothetical protein
MVTLCPNVLTQKKNFNVWDTLLRYIENENELSETEWVDHLFKNVQYRQKIPFYYY